MILNINKEICLTIEQFKGYFNHELQAGSSLYQDLLSYGRNGVIVKWLKEQGEKHLADAVDSILDEGDTDYIRQLGEILMGKNATYHIHKIPFNECLEYQDLKWKISGIEAKAEVYFKVLVALNETYEVCVNWGADFKRETINPTNFEEGEIISLCFNFNLTTDKEREHLSILVYTTKDARGSANDKIEDHNERDYIEKEGVLFQLIKNVRNPFLSQTPNHLSVKCNGTEFRLTKVCPGVFYMGKDKEDSIGEEYPRHKVEITKEFYVSEVLVTQEFWRAITGDNPSKYADDLQKPVHNVSWEMCKDFIALLNSEPNVRNKGLVFRLPTEAEWEYTARGGHRLENTQFSGSDKIDEVACYDNGSYTPLAKVKSYKPNALGIYDMSGNVSEWCEDTYIDVAYELHSIIDPFIDEFPQMGHVSRGGSYLSHKEKCYITSRSNSNSYSTIGLRLFLSITGNSSYEGFNIELRGYPYNSDFVDKDKITSIEIGKVLNEEERKSYIIKRNSRISRALSIVKESGYSIDALSVAGGCGCGMGMNHVYEDPYVCFCKYCGAIQKTSNPYGTSTFFRDANNISLYKEFETFVSNAKTSLYLCPNPSFPINGNPVILLSDLCNYHFWVRENKRNSNPDYNDTNANVIRHYQNLQQLIEDGWRIDYDIHKEITQVL